MAISSGRLFQPTYPVRGTTDYQLDDTPHYFISTHAPREGCDARAISRLVGLRAFQPTHPARGATRVHVLLVGGIRDFNPRTPRGVRLDALRGLLGSHLISIHAPREGCDEFLPYPFDSRGAISIHAPREGCDGRPFYHFRDLTNFNPRTPRGVRREAILTIGRCLIISIHAPREGCDWQRQEDPDGKE